MTTHSNKPRLSGGSATLLGVSVVLALAGCAGNPPTAELVRSESSVSQAIEVGAREHAPLELRAAETKLEQARAAANIEKDYNKARRLAEQSQADAELAAARSLSAKARMSVEELQKSIQLLRQELGLSQ